MWNLTYHAMNSNGSNVGGYEGSEMYTYIHNTILPNLKKSGLNITSCDLVSQSVFNDICTGVNKMGDTYTTIIAATIAGGEWFFLTDPNPTVVSVFYNVNNDGSIGDLANSAGSFGVRPLITVVK